MEIKTKFNIGQYVYYMLFGEIKNGKIKHIIVAGETEYTYEIRGVEFDEIELAETKEELIKNTLL